MLLQTLEGGWHGISECDGSVIDLTLFNVDLVCFGVAGDAWCRRCEETTRVRDISG